MSHTHDIDNEEPFLHFDPYEMRALFQSPSAALITSPGASLALHYSDMTSHDDLPPSGELHGFGEGVAAIEEEGKRATKPLPIPPVPVVHDIFEMTVAQAESAVALSHDEPSFSFSSSLSPSSFNLHSIPADDRCYASSSSSILRNEGSTSWNLDPDGSAVVMGKGKGKGREAPPVLPPLTFPRVDLSAQHGLWRPAAPISPAPELSLPNSAIFPSTNHPHTHLSASQGTGASALHEENADTTTTTAVAAPLLTRIPSRRRSFSNLSVHSTHSIAARSMSRIKIKFGPPRIPSNLARTLWLKKRGDSPVSPSPIHQRDEADEARMIISSGTIDATESSCLLPWRTEVKADVTCIPAPLLNPLDGLALYPSSNSHPVKSKGKGRSNSTPLPLSALDIVPETNTDVFGPIPIIIRNYFDEILPRELRLRVLVALVTLHEIDYERTVASGHWSMAKASSHKGQWVGKDKGLRELVKLSRVSSSWRTLVFDGQLWCDLNLRTFPGASKSLVTRITQTGGAFIKKLDVAGHVVLLPETLLDIVDNLCLASSPLAYTQLTNINLQGCTGLTTRSLHHLLVRSQSLQRLSVKGLAAVTNNTCNILAAYCPQLAYLNMSRCPNMNADGICYLAEAALTRSEHLPLKELHLSGLRHVDDRMMSTLGRAAPYLEVLDLSYARQLHNSAIDAFVACDGAQYKHMSDVDFGVRTMCLKGRDLGHDPSDLDTYRRRITRLRHLSLSHCLLLTDIACSNLSYSLPELEFFEMAGIGAALRDDGLVHLFGTTPHIRRLDLEDATEITDRVIATLTPAAADVSMVDDYDDDTVAEAEADGNIPQTGYALEHLVVSYATNVTNDALLALIRRCPRLRSLEVDNTGINSAVLREFVTLSRQRQYENAKIVAVDCRGIGESVVKELAASTRPRKGWRAYDARKLKYLDARDEHAEDLKVGQDECDEKRVVVKTFYSWQTVDAVKAAREKRRKATSRRVANESTGSAGAADTDEMGRRVRWWSPGGLRNGSRNSPQRLTDMNNEGCVLM